MRRLLVLTLALASLAPAVHAQPRRGDAAPDPGAEAFLNAPDGAAWIDTYGQAVVLDFWATWCAPCIATIPHLNALADAYADRPVVFVSLTAEDAETVRPFLEKRPIRGWVALDTDSTGGRAYGITAIPQTALIGRDGRLAAVVHPTQVTAALLDSLLAGIPLDRLPDRAIRSPWDSIRAVVQARRTLGRPDRPMEAESRIRWLDTGERPADRSGWGRPVEPTMRQSKWTGPLWMMLERSWIGPGPEWPNGVRPDLMRVVSPDSLEWKEATIDLVAPDVAEKDFREYAFEEIGKALGITIRDTEQSMNVLVLRQSEAGLSLKPAADPSRSRSSGARGVIAVRGLPLNRIAEVLQTCLEVPVIDETGVEGTYDLQLLMDPEVVHCDRPDEAQNEAVREALRETAGLDLVPETRTLPVTVVEQRP